MCKAWLVAVALLLAAAPMAWAQEVPLAFEAPRVSDIVRAILDEYEKEVKGNPPAATRQEAAQRRDKRLNELYVEAKQQRKPQHGALAIVCMHLRRFADAAKHCEAALQDPDNANKEDVYVVLVQALASDKHLKQAEERLVEGLKKFPASKQLPQLHNDLYRAYAQLGEPLKGAEHIRAIIENDWSAIAAHPQNLSAFLRNVDQLVGAYRAGKQPEQALAEVERLRARADRSAAEGLKVMEPLRDALLEKKVQLLASLGKFDEALAILQPQIDETRRHAEANPKLIPTLVQLSGQLQRKFMILDAAQSAAAKQAREEYLQLTEAQWAAHPQVPALANTWLAARSLMARLAMRDSDLDGAQKLLDEIQARQKVAEEKEETKPLVAQFADQVRLLVNALASERKRAALIGQPLPSLAGATWLNTAPLSDGDLKGKVVLLDFWAVWCGPCIATFPHLRDWHEKYADRGLQIVGVTRRYEFDFDSSTGRPQHMAGIAPADEDAATVKFLAHHKLKHAVAVMSDNALATALGVAGIPQAVLIDRSGAIRLIRVGSGEANAEALEAAIEKYLAEPAVSAGGK